MLPVCFQEGQFSGHIRTSPGSLFLEFYLLVIFIFFQPK